MKNFALFLYLGVSLIDAGEITFNQHIRPILSDKCFGCHGPSKDRKADLRLDTFEGATDSKRKGGAAIVIGKADISPLVTRMESKDPEDIMPPLESHKTLSKDEINLIKTWINRGAKYQKHWSFMPIRKGDKTSMNFIDHYVAIKQKEQGLKFNTKADKRHLLRRTALDLTGLPPSQDQLQTFLKDNSEEAYEKQIDQLLNSSHYGEHMARIWLDLVRYADTHGLHADNYREMFLYRDWVIQAYEDNMPFDQFCREQIAGDMIANPSESQLIASGFNRLHLSNSAGSALKEELYVNNVMDRVNAFGTVFMGLTLGCAACHDHKYDPISQKEYYQLFAFFNNIDGDPDNKLLKNPEPALHFPNKEQEQAIAELETQIKTIEDKKEKDKLKKELKKLKNKVISTMIMKERSKSRPAYILIRGQYDQKGEQVTRATPAILPKFKDKHSLDRLGLAEWITDDDHPLLARITVNRLWQQCFGIGLFQTSQDLGSQGEWPTHPELLDALANYLIESSWDIKATLKLIVSSQTYQQSSHRHQDSYQRDPDNRLLARGARFRMDAEMLRDQALYVSGLLSEKRFGPSIKVPQPKGLWDAVALKASNTKLFVADKGEDILRRSIYTFWKRSSPPPAMTIFNAPSRETCVSRRERTNTPLQALVLMNEEQFFQASKALGQQTHSKEMSLSDKAKWLYEKITCLLPTSKEEQLILDSYQAYLKDHEPEFAWTMIANTLLNLDISKSKG